MSAVITVHMSPSLRQCRSATKAIENRLLLETTQKQLVTAYLQLSSLMDVVPEGLLLVDPEGYITRINQTGSTLLGISPQECIGQPLENILNVPATGLANSNMAKASWIVLQL
jgi:sensor histidine kinase regulating citrate/malate metabolism